MQTHVCAYRLTAYIPEENPTETGIIICPGGSYFWLDKETEGENVAKWLCENHIAAFVLEYSHAGWAAYAYHFREKGRSYPAAFHDLSSALDSIRSQAAGYGINPERIGCMGFSAGGHLVMHTAEKLAGTPAGMAFAALIYPVVSMTHACTHKRSRRGLLGEFPGQTKKEQLSLENHVTSDCPPVFLMNCKDDPIVNYRNSELLDSALTVHQVPHRYVVYQTGGHGFGVSEDKTTQEAIQWKRIFLEWLESHRLTQITQK